VDECTQCLEPSSVVALGRGCQQLVLIGDHKQLPPTVFSVCATDNGERRDILSWAVAPYSVFSVRDG
jgi:superfamily I DNA and/or RNA helicase